MHGRHRNWARWPAVDCGYCMPERQGRLKCPVAEKLAPARLHRCVTVPGRSAGLFPVSPWRLARRAGKASTPDASEGMALSSTYSQWHTMTVVDGFFPAACPAVAHERITIVGIVLPHVAVTSEPQNRHLVAAARIVSAQKGQGFSARAEAASACAASIRLNTGVRIPYHVAGGSWLLRSEMLPVFHASKTMASV